MVADATHPNGFGSSGHHPVQADQRPASVSLLLPRQAGVEPLGSYDNWQVAHEEVAGGQCHFHSFQRVGKVYRLTAILSEIVAWNMTIHMLRHVLRHFVFFTQPFRVPAQLTA